METTMASGITLRNILTLTMSAVATAVSPSLPLSAQEQTTACVQRESDAGMLPGVIRVMLTGTRPIDLKYNKDIREKLGVDGVKMDQVALVTDHALCRRARDLLVGSALKTAVSVDTIFPMMRVGDRYFVKIGSNHGATRYRMVGMWVLDSNLTRIVQGLGP
jgi:hypothetical protein